MTYWINGFSRFVKNNGGESGEKITGPSDRTAAMCRGPGKMALPEKKTNGAGLSVSLLLLAGGLRACGTVGAHIACIGNLALEPRFRFVLRLPGFRAAGRLVLLFLLPGEFPLSFLEGEFCSCHGLPPLAFPSLWESVRTKKKASRCDSRAPERPLGHNDNPTRVLRFRPLGLFGPVRRRN